MTLPASSEYVQASGPPSVHPSLPHTCSLSVTRWRMAADGAEAFSITLGIGGWPDASGRLLGVQIHSVPQSRTATSRHVGQTLCRRTTVPNGQLLHVCSRLLWPRESGLHCSPLPHT